MKSERLLSGRATILHGDCLKMMLRFKNVRHVITDPPYEAVMHKAKAKATDRGRSLRSDGGPALRALKFEAVDDIRNEVCLAAKDVCDGWFIAFCSPEGIAPWRDSIEAAKMRYKRACFFYKPDAAPQFNGQGPAFAVEPFVTAWCGKGVSKWNGGGRRNLFSHNTNGRDRDGTHETEKPISLMMEIIELFTNPGDVILDPFMGSGTTGIAAVALGRKFIGIEKDEKSYRLAKGRLQSAFTGRIEGRAIIAKLIGSDDPGPLFETKSQEVIT